MNQAANMTYICDNQTSIIVRWRIFMKLFKFTIQKMPGIKIRLVDYHKCKYFGINSAVVLNIDEQVDDMINNMLRQIIMAIQVKKRYKISIFQNNT